MSRPKKLRLNYFTFKRFQIPILLMTLLNFALFFTFVFIMVKRSYTYLEELGLKAEFKANHPYFTFLEFQENSILVGLLIAGIVGALTSSVITIYFSHKMAGPLVRLKHYFNGLAEGNIQEISFRKGDYIEDWAPLINKGHNHFTKRDAS